MPQLPELRYCYLCYAPETKATQFSPRFMLSQLLRESWRKNHGPNQNCLTRPGQLLYAAKRCSCFSTKACSRPRTGSNRPIRRRIRSRRIHGNRHHNDSRHRNGSRHRGNRRRIRGNRHRRNHGSHR